MDKKTKYGFIGMNKYAAKHIGVPFNHPSNVVTVYKNLPKDVRTTTIHHEECERYLMKNKHYRYNRAHKVALRFEKLNKPFPDNNVQATLRAMKFDIN